MKKIVLTLGAVASSSLLLPFWAYHKGYEDSFRAQSWAYFVRESNLEDERNAAQIKEEQEKQEAEDKKQEELDKAFREALLGPKVDKQKQEQVDKAFREQLLK